jgi:predicted TIM-barrel fold metal-dependent hydrolase
MRTLPAHHHESIMACDTHVHVIGAASHYPMVVERQYTPGTASTADLQQHLQYQDMRRVTVVQPSVYGTDNTCLLDTLDTMPHQARGVAVCDPSVTSVELQQLDARGVRGLRLNLESSSNHNAQVLRDALRYWAPRITDLGWHLQVYAPFAVTAACASVIAQLPLPVVLDHFALWPHRATDANQIEQERNILQLLTDGHIYIKLSASYRSPAYAPEALTQLAHRLLQTRPDRLLWGSDWPHTNRDPGLKAHQVSRYRPVDPQQLRNERQTWLNNSDWVQRVLVDNPQSLYRFN